MFRFDPTSRIALILRRLRSHTGITAPRVAIKTELPWHWRAFSVIALLLLALLGAAWIYATGLSFAGFHIVSSTQELAELREQVRVLSAERDEASKVANASDSRLMIEATTHERLSNQIKRLEDENARLKADLVMLEKLAGGDDRGPAGLEISRLQVFPDGASGQFRYRMLVAQKGGARGRDFKGGLQLQASLFREGRPVNMTFPEANEPRPEQFVVSIRRFGRLEGVFNVPEGAKLRSIEARLIESGNVQASATAAL
jgi:hypothetical protein